MDSYDNYMSVDGQQMIDVINAPYLTPTSPLRHSPIDTHIPIDGIDQNIPIPPTPISSTSPTAQVNNLALQSVQQGPVGVGDKTYKCLQCGRSYETKKKLKTHLVLHRRQKVHPCPYCDKSFTIQSKLKLHIRIHTGEKPFECVHCGKKFSVKGGLTAHLMTHTNDKPFTCDHCDLSFRTAYSLKSHSMVHTIGQRTIIRPHSCGLCDKGFTSANRLKIHMRTHTGERPFVCRECGKGYVTKEGHERHMVTHMAKNVQFCEVCLKGFHSLLDLQAHEQTHKQGQYPCLECGEIHMTQNKLKMHMRMAHSHVKFTCSECDITKPTKESLQNHMLVHLGQKQFPCPQCDKCFRDKNRLNVHLRTHSGEKPYFCPECKKRFSSIWHLKAHKMTHSGIKTNVCDLCDKSFLTKSELKNHMILHTGERPFVCGECGHAFTRVGALNWHRKKCHLKDEQHQNPEVKEMVKPKAQGHRCLKCNRKFSSRSEFSRHMFSHMAHKKHQCSQCAKAFYTAEALNKHSKEHEINKPHLCSHCGESFSLGENLIKHMLTHAISDKHVCMKCGTACETAAELAKHVKSHIITKSFTCNYCDKQFPNDAKLNKHMSTHRVINTDPEFCEDAIAEPNKPNTTAKDDKKTTEKSYICEDCGKTFGKSESLKRHRKIHTDKAFVCEECGKRCSTKFFLRKHMQSHSRDNEPWPYICPECGKGFKNTTSLDSHVLTHQVDGPYICTVCGKEFGYSRSLVLHMMTHTGNKPHKCEICAKTFTTEFTLKQHQSIHSGEKPHECSVCAKKFRLKLQLDRHMRSHTGERPFKCLECGMCFQQSGTLSAHKKVHTGVTPYSCDLCGKKFQRLNQLKAHQQKNHSGEESVYECMECGQSFNWKASLDRHLLMHSGDRPHKCSHCQQGFIDQKQLAKHLAGHTGEFPLKSSQCSEGFGSRNALVRHEIQHNQGEGIVCSDCGQSFSTTDKLNDHLLSHRAIIDPCNNPGEQDQTENHACLECSQSFSSQIALFEHRSLNHCSPLYVCSECGERMEDSQQMNEHLKTHLSQDDTQNEHLDIVNSPAHNRLEMATDGQQAECNDKDGNNIDDCSDDTKCHDYSPPTLTAEPHNAQKHNLQFSQTSHYSTQKSNVTISQNGTKHGNVVISAQGVVDLLPDLSNNVIIEDVSPQVGQPKSLIENNDQEKFNCRKCNKTFATAKKLYGHMATHKEKNLSCSDCGKSYRNVRNLMLHKTSHTRDRPVVCFHCSSGFQHYRDLIEHLEMNKVEKTHECLECDETFWLRQELVHHKRNHKSNDLFTCAHCVEKFSSRSCLNLHLKSHSTSKCHVCPECKGQFASSKTLSIHLACHRKQTYSINGRTYENDTTNGFTLGNGATNGHKYEIHTDIQSAESAVSNTSTAPISKSDEEPGEESPCAKYISNQHNIGANSEKMIYTESPKSVVTKTSQISEIEAINGETNFKVSENEENAKLNELELSTVCMVCNAEMEDEDAMMEHLKEHINTDVEIVKENGTDASAHTSAECNTTKLGKYVCPTCKKKFQFISQLLKHKISTHNTRKYLIRCQQCSAKFKNSFELTKHMAELHKMNRLHGYKYLLHKTASTPRQCEEIQKDQNGNQMNRNGSCNGEKSNSEQKVGKLDDQKKIHECHFCKSKFNTPYKLKSHRRVHTGERPYSCARCGKAFATRNTLKAHERVHSGERPYSCSHCGKRFHNKGAVIVHERIHTGVKPFSCSHCSRAFNESCALKRHMRTHTGERPFMCDICGLTFSTTTTLSAHTHRHTNNKVTHACSKCDRTFQYTHQLDRHHSTLHTDPRECSRFICSVCEANFTNRNSLMMHMMTHRDKSEFGIEERSASIIVKCHNCPEEFFSKRALLRHKKLVHNEGLISPKLCEQCGKICRTQAGYKKHILQNHTEKAHICSICSKSFDRKQSLVLHMKTHGEKKYVCHCGDSFFYPLALGRHKKLVHRENTCKNLGTTLIAHGNNKLGTICSSNKATSYNSNPSPISAHSPNTQSSMTDGPYHHPGHDDMPKTRPQITRCKNAEGQQANSQLHQQGYPYYYIFL